MRCSKKLLTIVSITLLNIMLASCSGINSQNPELVKKNDTPIKAETINLMTSWGGVDSKAGILKEIIAKFEDENPNIKIVNQSIFGDDYLPTLKTKFASGSGPDVFGLWPGSDIKYLIKAGKIADITDTLKQDRTWMDSFKQSSFSSTTYNNRIYGIPFEVAFEGLFINKDLFDKYGVKEPVNYKELKEAVIVFRKNGIIPIAYNSTAEGSYIYQNIIASLGGSKGVEEYLVDGRINSYYIAAMKYMKELNDMGAFSEDSIMIYSDERNNLFFSKQAAMIVQGSWFIPYFDKDDTSVKMIPFPSMTEEEPKMPTGLGGGTFYISKSAWDSLNKKDTSIAFLKYLTSKETAVYFYEKTGLITNLNMEMDLQKAYSSLAEQSAGVFKRIPDKNKTPIPDLIIERAAWEDVVIKNFPKFLLGNTSAEEIWDQAVQKIND
ncbi:raffinose/stachyose/melibiose transport system substrate-binding protein [Ruminiclostridium sufflavum DSM 19573]|uniref:Raffinose/stachyose/melibiose transport system substrate-binding protein n=1 Tax=Ruminiclostridium sufflavum DSM 19573 TaxID=1121337 RepID=A0A318XQS2_9FIRM|nr:extracellular solute-binding protein [Ruminiclostridium sufflavum]PYG89756.1 raffinose/stachyose/melibiose transport system substrate-binding protein [Ruminiclostridium sufflavum DSM 19573]